jgi:RsiW-degrading membrane proteinase PrsW (M82 family)
MSPVITFQIVVYVIILIFNWMVLLAFFQRKYLPTNKKKNIRDIILSLLLATPSVFVILPVLFITDFPEYGIKYWPGESKNLNEKWYYRNLELLEAESGKLTECEGIIVDIWKTD